MSWVMFQAVYDDANSTGVVETLRTKFDWSNHLSLNAGK